MVLISGSFEKARLYINTHSRDTGKEMKSGVSITMSRQAGAGADVVSRLLVEFLRPYVKEGDLEWTVFDKNLIERILSDHNLPERLTDFFEEKKQTLLQSMVNEIFTGHTSFEILRKTTRTILQLVHKGNVIIIGRGATIITAGMKNVFQVRLVANIEKRIPHIMEVYELTRKEAADFLKREDEARHNFVKRFYHKNIDDPLLYDLIINTGKCSYEEAAEIIGTAVVKRFNLRKE